MRETKGHGGEVLGVESLEERGQLLSDSSVEVKGGRVRNDLDTELFGDSSSELGVTDNEGLLDTGRLFRLLAVGDLIDEELGENLGELSLLELGEVLDGVGGRRESVDSLELEAS